MFCVEDHKGQGRHLLTAAELEQIFIKFGGKPAILPPFSTFLRLVIANPSYLKGAPSRAHQSPARLEFLLLGVCLTYTARNHADRSVQLRPQGPRGPHHR